MSLVYQHIRKDTGEVFYIGIGKTLIDKIDYFISLRDKIDDKELYERMERMLVEMCQILYCGYKSRYGFKLEIENRRVL